jgi:hypothetical protein
MPARHLLSSPDAGKYIGKSEETMRQWRRRGLGPPYLRQGRSISYLKSDLDQYLQACRCGGTKPQAAAASSRAAEPASTTPPPRRKGDPRRAVA